MPPNDTSPILVFGATGAQGGAVVRRLVKAGHTVLGLARSDTAAGTIAAMGAEPRLVRALDADELHRAMAGAGRMVLSLPLGMPTSALRAFGQDAIHAAARAGIGLIVFNTGTRIPDAPTDIDAFEEKRAIETALAESGLDFVSLRPSFYYGNLAGPWTAPAIREAGVLAYPLPVALRASWLGWDDMAGFVEAALTRPALSRQRIDVGGPEALTGEALAARLAEGLGRAVTYQPIPPDAFEIGLAAAIGPDAARPVGALYRWIAERPSTTLFSSNGEALAERFAMPLESLAAWAARNP